MPASHTLDRTGGPDYRAYLSEKAYQNASRDVLMPTQVDQKVVCAAG